MGNRYFGELSTDVYGINVDEKKVAHIALTAAQACAADTDGLIDGETLGATEKTVTTFLNDMPYARNVTIVASAATGEGAKAVVYGTNLADEVISEDFTLAGNTPVVGNKAFKTVTKIVLPVKNDSETVAVGWGSKLGIPFKLDAKPLTFAMQNGVIETTAPTLAIDDDEVEKNTITINSALHDEKAVDIFLFL